MSLDREWTLGQWKGEDTNGEIGREMTYDTGRRYRVVKIAGGQYLRDGDSLEVNTNTWVAVMSTAEYTDAIMIGNLNTFPIATTAYRYGLVQTGGPLIRGALTLETLSNDLAHMPLITNYVTGTAAAGTRQLGMVENALAEKTIAGSTANINGNATACVLTAASSLFAQDCRVGDTLNTNVLGVVATLALISSNTVCLLDNLGVNSTSASLKLMRRSPRTMEAITLTGSGPVVYDTQYLADCVVNTLGGTNTMANIINANSISQFRVGDIVNVISSNGTADVKVIQTINTDAANTTINCNSAFALAIATATDKNMKIWIKGKRAPAVMLSM